MARQRLIVPIFIPHQGCPYICVFCNQTEITGADRSADKERVEGAVQTFLGSRPREEWPPCREVAFYGGTFTGLPLWRQRFLLSLVQPWVDRGEIHSIRLSTHSLFVDTERLNLLKEFPVDTVELGIQSTDAKVLRLSGREGGMDSVPAAVDLLRTYGFKLGLQLMLGLPGDTEETFRISVDDTLRLKPDFVRIYPALVIRNTALHDLYQEGSFVPWDLERTLESLKTAVLKFDRAGIPVIRIGLHPEPSLLDNFVAGPFHPSIRYLVNSRICRDEMVNLVERRREFSDAMVFKVPSHRISDYIGYRKENVKFLKEKFHFKEVAFRPGDASDSLEWVA